MLINLLAVGDVVAAAGLNCLKTILPKLKQEKKIDFCVVNGENTALLGLLPRQAEEIFNAGADVITMGNHTWGSASWSPIWNTQRASCVPPICLPSSRAWAGTSLKRNSGRSR